MRRRRNERHAQGRKTRTVASFWQNPSAKRTCHMSVSVVVQSACRPCPSGWSWARQASGQLSVEVEERHAEPRSGTPTRTTSSSSCATGTRALTISACSCAEPCSRCRYCQTSCTLLHASAHDKCLLMYSAKVRRLNCSSRSRVGSGIFEVTLTRLPTR